jgi:hypothetical protein
MCYHDGVWKPVHEASGIKISTRYYAFFYIWNENTPDLYGQEGMRIYLISGTIPKIVSNLLTTLNLILVVFLLW